MNKIIGISASVLVISVMIIAGIAVNRPVNVNVTAPEINMGSIAGPDVYFPVRFHQATAFNFPVLATTTVGSSITLLGADLVKYGMIDVMQNLGSMTYTMPATSTMNSILPNVGDARTWKFRNATTTVASTLTIVKGTGMYLVGLSANDDVIDGNEFAELTCTRIYYRAANNADVACFISEWNDAD